MIATPSRRSIAAREQWRPGSRSRARLLARQILAAEKRRVEKLVENNLHLLRLCSGFFHKRYPMIPRDDIEQSAFFGLRRAAELFDETKSSAQFHTYAFNWTRATVQEEMFRMRSTIRVPRRASTPIPKVSSFDRDDGSTFGALIVDEDAADPLNEAHRADLRERLAAALGTLDPRDALVVALHFGINGASRPHTYVEIAAHLGVCANRARQIERRALGHLRDALASFAE